MLESYIKLNGTSSLKLYCRAKSYPVDSKKYNTFDLDILNTFSIYIRAYEMKTTQKTVLLKPQKLYDTYG